MARLQRHERIALARKRIANVLRDHAVAGMRTLENKISDAGPNHMRIDPHILTHVRQAMEDEGVILKHHRPKSPPWHALSSTPDASIQARLDLLVPIQARFEKRNLTNRIGQALEIACLRAIRASGMQHFGDYPDLDAHDDATSYKKDEPPQKMNGGSIGNENLDFFVVAGGVVCGIEVKNLREWLYPDRPEVRNAIRKALSLDIVPVLVARRIHYVTFRLLSPMGLIVHQTYNQLLPDADADLANLARDKKLLGYHDIRTGNQPDARLLKFFQVNLPQIAADARTRMLANRDLLWAFAVGDMPYTEFAGRARRRMQGLPEDGDWKANEDPNDFDPEDL